MIKSGSLLAGRDAEKGAHVRRFLAIILGCAAVFLNPAANSHAQDAGTAAPKEERIAEASHDPEEVIVEPPAPWRLALTQFASGAISQVREGDEASGFAPLAEGPGLTAFSQGVMYDPGAALLVSWAEGGAWPGPEIRSYRGLLPRRRVSGLRDAELRLRAGGGQAVSRGPPMAGIAG